MLKKINQNTQEVKNERVLMSNSLKIEMTACVQENKSEHTRGLKWTFFNVKTFENRDDCLRPRKHKRLKMNVFYVNKFEKRDDC